MTKDDILTFLKAHKNELMKNYNLTEIGLFGSYAKDEADEDSDIDIVIKSNKKDFFIREDLREYLEKHLQKSVDIGYIDSFRQFYKKRIEKDIIFV